LKYIYPSYLRMLESVEADPRIPQSFKSFARREIPCALERTLRPYIIREAVEDSPRELEEAITGLLESNDSSTNRRLALGARLLQGSRLLRRLARMTLAVRRSRTQAKVDGVARSYEFAPYVRV
jgi:hypothetical protein